MGGTLAGMRIKLFHGARIAEAMAKVRAELGSEALILATRAVGGGVEITAAIAGGDEAAPVAMRAAEPVAAEDSLIWHGIPAALAQRLRTHGALAEGLAAVLRFGALGVDSPLLLVGPPGGGKSFSVARMAARLVQAGGRPFVISADGSRAGAAEDLAAFTRLLGLDLIVATTPKLVARAVAHAPAGEAVIIDSAGVNAFDAAAMGKLAALQRAAGARMVAVLPAGLDVMEAADLAEAFVACGAAHLLPTKLDLARRLGAVVTAAIAGELPISLAGTGSGVADGLSELTPAILARRLDRMP